MKKSIFLLLLTAFCLSAAAKVKPASPFSDGMVLQQNSNVNIWGSAKANSKVTAKGTWNNKTVTVNAGADGSFKLQIATPKGSFTPYELQLSDGEKTTIHNVLVGEVWVGSGQSNMEMGLSGRKNRVIENVNRELLNAGNYTGRLHLAIVQHNAQSAVQNECPMKWEDCTTATAAPWSAACYFFATTLIDALHVPVGMIETCWGGTSVESWSPASILPAAQTEADKKDFSVRYNGMIHPLEGYSIKGFIWYQGEHNVGHYELYASQMSKMITAWRQTWKQGNLPFYQVEISPYNYEANANGVKGALLREAQLQAANNTPNTGIICTNDLIKPFELNQIHPMMKREVGERLAYLALSRDYKVKGILAEFPQYKKLTIKDNKALVSFTNAEMGFNRFDDIQGFELCGADKKFYPAQATVKNVSIELTSPKVLHPTAVRYCFKNFQIGNLANNGGLPVFPFRTDK